MTFPALAERAGLSRATVCRILKNKQGSSSLESVLAIGKALGAEMDIRLQEPALVVEHEIQAKARRIVRMVQGTMALEAQGLTEQSEFDQLVEVAAAEIRAKPRKQLWMSQGRNPSRSTAKRRSQTSPS
jgi:transcriptional regulator with XRE-family HTH domain